MSGPDDGYVKDVFRYPVTTTGLDLGSDDSLLYSIHNERASGASQSRDRAEDSRDQLANHVTGLTALGTRRDKTSYVQNIQFCFIPLNTTIIVELKYVHQISAKRIYKSIMTS